MSTADAIDALCREICRRQEAHDATLNREDQFTTPSMTFRAQVIGELFGLRKALCVLMGWSLDEAAEEGQADAYVEEWRRAQQ